MDNLAPYFCPVCGNVDIHSIGYLNGKPYCRRCISFKGKEVEHKPSYPKKAPIHLAYELSPEQIELSDKLVENYKKGIDSLVFALCGSGKTEICLNLIKFVVSKGLHVGFAVPRKSVCCELGMRLKEIFNKNTVAIVFGGHHKIIEGDIICLTTHQLFRYEQYFDLLIMDEIDAFPYKGNNVLQQMFKRSVKGHHVLLSATPTKELIDEYKKHGKDLLKLFARFHHHALPVPQIITGNIIKLNYILIKKLRYFIDNNKPVFVFVPTIDYSKKLCRFLKLFFSKGTYINSKKENQQSIIDNFRKGKIQYLVTTAVLERGVTIKDLQVIVYKADHGIYDSSALIQIAGRVGRKKDAPEGEVIFLAKRKNKHMERAVEDIVAANKSLQNMLQNNENR